MAPDLIEHFEARGGYLKPPETTDRLDKVDEMLADDLPALTNV